MQAADQAVLDPLALWALDSAPLAQAHERALLCAVGATQFAVPIQYLRAVEPYRQLTPVPHMPPWVLGLTNVRGAVVGVVDLARFLELGETPREQARLLLCGDGPRLAALAVAGARDVLDYPPERTRPAEQLGLRGGEPGGLAGLRGRVARFLAGLIQTDTAAVPVLAVDRLLADEELVRG